MINGIMKLQEIAFMNYLIMQERWS